MPLIDDPQVGRPLYTPRGFMPLPEINLPEQKPINPTPPEEEDNVTPEWTVTPAEKQVIIGSSFANPLVGVANLLATNPTIQAAFRSENTIGSAIARWQDTLGVTNDLVDPFYNPWDDVAGTPYEQYWSTFAFSNNKAYTEALKRSIDRQNLDRQIVAAGGFGGYVAGMLAGTADPTLLIPVGGEISLAGKGVWNLGRGAITGIKAAGIGVTAQEAALQATQDVRPGSESAMNISTGIVLGAVLGGGIAGALSRTQRLASEKALEHVVSIPIPGSAGAAAPERMTLDDLTVNGTITQHIAAATAYSPNLRGNFRQSPLARQTYQEIATNVLRQQMHNEGRTPGPSIEDHITVSIGETYNQAEPEHLTIFRQGKKAGFGMSSDQFDQSVAKAMRREDIGENEFVTKSAQMWRAKVVEPLTKQAIDLGLLPEDVSVTEAPSYFMRVYNTDKMIAQKPEFIKLAEDYYNEKLKEQYGAQREKLLTRKQALEEEKANLTLTPEERVAKLSTLEEQKAELEKQFAPQEELAQQIRDQNAAIRKAKKEGDTAAEEAARQKREAIRASGGEDFQAYKRAQATINKTIKQIGLGYAGMQDKANAIRDQLTDLSQNNFKNLQRLVRKGQQVAKEMRRLDPKVLEQKLSDLRTQFYALITRAEQAQERLTERIAKLKGDVDKSVQDALKTAGLDKEKLTKAEQKKAARIEKDIRENATQVQEALEKGLAAEQSKTERLTKISERMQAAEAINHTAELAEIKKSVDELVLEVSNASLGRGEKAAALNERLSKLDLKKVDEHVASIDELQKDLERDFLNRWEIKRLGEGVDPHDPDAVPNFSAHAKDIAQEIYDAITGNDYGSASVDPGLHLAAKSGPLKDRTFHIPDAMIEPFLENNVATVMQKFSRTMSAQIAVERLFPGDPLLAKRFEAIKNEYDILVNAAEDEKTRQALQKDMKGTFRDLRALLEIHRGTYLAEANASNWGRLVRVLMGFNFIRSMGGAAIPSLSDIYNPAMFHGWGRVMQAGVPHLLEAINGIGPLAAEAKFAGVAERLTHHRLLTLSEIGDPYSKGNAIERLMANGTRVAAHWNGLNYLTDFEKRFTSIVVQHHLNEALLKGTDDPFLAYSGMNAVMRSRVADQLRLHGEDLDGIIAAHTDQWEDFDAQRAYRIAVARNVNADIVTRGVGDVPLLAYTPMGKLLLQFKTFNLAAHQRTMLRAMQMPGAQFLSGLIGLTTMGMLATVLRAWRGGKENWERFQESAKNPGYMVGEGLDMTGFFTLPIEIGNIVEKATAVGGFAVNPVKTPLLIGGRFIVPDSSIQGNSQKYAGRGPWGSVLGPTSGLVEDSLVAAGGAVNKLSGDEATQGQLNAATRIVPFGSYYGMRTLLQWATDNSPIFTEDEKQ